MPDKKYLIEIPDMPDGSGVWDADKWERNKEAFMADYPNAQVFELGEYDEADSRESDQILLSFEDEASSGIWDQAKWERNKYAFTKDNPEAQVSRVRYVDYWGQKADANRAERASLMQPDEERNAKLAELGYYDDLSKGQRDFDLNAPNMVGLKPLSSAIDTNSVSGHTTYLDPRVQEFFANDSAYTDKMAEIARLDAEYDENPAVIAQREWEAQMLAEQKAYADNLEKEIKGNLESDVDMRKAARGGTAKRGYDPLESQQMSYLLDQIAGEEAGSGEYENEKLERYTTSLKFLEKAKIARDLTGKGFGGAVIDWGKEGLMDAGTQDDVEAYNEIGNILTRLEKEVGNLKEENLTEDVFDKYLSKDEQALIKSFFEYNKAMADAQQDMSRAYKGGKIFAESIPFMLEFLATGGIYKGAGRAATKGLERALVKWVSKAARNTANRTARKIAAATARDLTYALVGTTARTLASPGTYERMAEASVEIEDGHLNRAKNAAIAAADMYVENLSEISGGLIGKTLGWAGKGVGKLIAKTPLSKVGGMLADNKLMQSISAFMPKLEALGFHGLPEEIGEEFIGNAIREVLNIQPGALKEMVSDDNFGAMLIGFAPMTLIGAAGGAISLGAINYEAAKLGNKMREMMSDHYSAEEMDAMMSAVEGAATAEEIQQAIKPMAIAVANAVENGMITQEQAAEEIEMLYQWGGFMAQNKALLFSKKAQENELANAKRAEMVDQYGRFWQEDETESVQVATLNNGSTVFVTSAPAEDGKITTIDVQTGKKGFANISDIATQEVEGEQIQSSNKMTMDAFLNGQIAMGRKTAEETRMTNERNAQIDALRAEITPGTRINLGTEGSPVYVFAKKTSNNGVTIVDETGMESTLGWEQAADALGRPIIVETDQQKLDAEVSARLQRLAERRMQRNISPAVENATTEAAEESAEVVAQEQKHIPLNEDGTVNEAAFWTQDPEGYAEWNDEQNQDGGQDTLRQIAISKAEMFALLAEAQSRQNTSNPAARKAAEKEAAIIAEKIQRLQAMEMKYADALAEEKEAVKQTAATPTATMSEEQLEQMDTQYQGILGKTRIQSERVRVMQEYLNKLAEDSAPIRVLTKDNYEEVMRAEGCPEDDIKRVGKALNRKRGGQVAGFASNGVTFVMANTIADINSARITYIHERQHLLNSQNPEVVKQFAAALGDKENALRILETFVDKNGLEEYKNDSIERLADEIICRSMEIVYSTENYSVDLQNQGLSEEAINIINTIDNGQRTDKSLSSARRSSYVNGSRRENIEENGRNSEQVSGGILGEQEAGSLGSSGRGDGLRGQGSTGEGAEVISEEQLNAPNSGTAQQITAADGEVLADTNGKGGVRFSIRTWNEGGRDYLAAWLANDAVLTEEEKADILARMDEFYKNALLYSDTYVPFGTWSDAEVRYDNEGNPLMSVVKANGDYAMNLDFSLVCKKRRPLNRLLRTLINRNAFGSYDLKERELAEINWILQEHGFEVACALCFVDSKRYRVAGVADVFAKLWNNLVTSLAPNGVQIAHFNYNDNPNVEPVENGLDTLPDDQLNWKKLDKAVAKFKKGSVEYKVAQYLREHPEARKLVDATDFIEAEGFEAVKEANPDLLKFYNMKKGTGGPKASFGDVQYLNDILKSGKKFDVEKAYAVGGVRLQSFSDFVPHMYFDYMQLFAELAAKKLPLHAYTKEVLFAKIFGLTGAKINMSLVPAVVEGGIAPGLDAEGNYAWADPVTDAEGNVIQQGQSFPYDEAMAIQQTEGYSKNCGVIAVGISDAHIEKMMEDPNIPFIIPYHKSSLNAIVARMTNIDQYKDYTNVQNTRKASGSKLDKGTKDFNFNEYLHDLGESGTPQQAAQAYLDWCRENKFIPKFSQFAYHPNYYKLLQDFNTIDLTTGEYAPQGAVTMTFPTEESAFGNVETLIQQGLQEDVALEEKMEQEIDGIADQVIARLEEIAKEPKMSDKQRVEKMAELADERMTKIKEQSGVIDLVEEAKKAVAKEEAKKPNKGSLSFRMTTEMKEIKEKAQADGTFMKAPNGQPTNLTEEQWLMVRTKNFINWFGDWLKPQRVEKLRQSESISLDGDEYVGKYELNKESAFNYILNELSGSYVNKDTGDEIKVSYKGAKKVTSHGYKDPIHLASIVHIPRMIQEAIFITEEPNLKRKNEFETYRYYVCGVNIDGEEYTAKIVVGVRNNETYYDHQLSSLEKGKLIDSRDLGTTRLAEDEFTLLDVKDKRLISILQNDFSKVVDENGEPKVVYHQTNQKIYVNRETGENWDELGWKEKMEWDNRDDWEDYWEEQDFNTFSRVNARTTNEFDGFFFAPEYDEYHEYGDRTIAAFVNIKNPASREDYNIDSRYNDAGRNERIRLQEAGFDGVIRMDGDNVDEYIAFEPNQIKSATDNNGDFNPKNNNISFRVANENQAIFVSNAAKAVEGIKQEKATPEQWLKMIEKNGGLKAGEDKWMGLSDWLKASDKKTLTKQEVLDFIKENMIVIEEQHYSNKGVREEADRILNENYPGWEDAFSFDWDPFMDEPHSDIYNEVKAARLYNEHHEDQVETDEDGDIVNDADYNKVEEFGAELAGIWYGRGKENTVREIHGTREEYTTNGLTNLHEIALTVPTIVSWNESDDIHFGDAGEGRAVAWIRFGETWEQRPSPKISRKVLVIDEIQSKRHQEGREKGYKDTRALWADYDQRREELKAYVEELAEQSGIEEYKVMSDAIGIRRQNSPASEKAYIKRMNERWGAEVTQKFISLTRAEDAAREAIFGSSNGVPDAPFDKNWHELAMKRMLRYAAENGYDVIAWTKGEQQADRYALTKAFNSIEREDRPDGDGGRRFSLYGGNVETIYVDENGVVTSSSISDELNGKPLSDVVGKDLAVKMMSLENYDTIDGEDLRIGGEGMKGFYDKMLPAFMNKYGKKWGVKVEDIDLPNLENGLTMHSVPVTEEMKASVMGGQVMFRMRTEEEDAMEFTQQAINDCTSRYNEVAEVKVFPANEETAERFGYTMEEMQEIGGTYLKDEDIIAIFALQGIKDSRIFENIFFHESIHKLAEFYPEFNKIGEWMWNNADVVGLQKIKDNVKKAYEQEWHHEEMLAYGIANAMSLGRVEQIESGIPEEYKSGFRQILNEIGYEPEKESRRDESRVSESIRRGAAAMERKTDESGRSKKEEARTGELTAKERRVIGEYFPEFNKSEDVRYRISDVNTNPTEAQKKAGNFKKGHIRLDSYNITIENPKGSVRRGTDSKGNTWENTLNNDYGYIRGTEGVDGDHIDVYLSDNPTEGNVFVIDQVNPETREFDEHKVMYGFNSAEEAREAYLANFSEGWNGLGTITEVSKDEFKKWIESSHRKTKPFSEYKSVRANEMQTTDDSGIRYRANNDSETGVESLVERTFRTSGAFSFSGKEKIESRDDVAFIFKQLEDSAIENSFLVFVKDGIPTIIHVGMGDIASTMIDNSVVLPAYKDFGADKIYMVHNHPSGSLYASKADLESLFTITKQIPDVSVEGIIINTVSGEYASFDLTDSTQSLIPDDEGKVPVKVLSFDKNVFAPDYKSKINERRIKGSGDVASFLSAHRLGEGAKVGALLLNRQNIIYGNLVTNDNEVSIENADTLASQIAEAANRTGSSSVILFGDFDYSDKALRALSKGIKNASGNTINLLDVVRLEGNHTLSLADDTLPSRSTLSDGIRFRVTGTPTDEVVANGLILTPAQTAEVAANIFAALPEESRKKITDGLNGNILGLKDAILQIPTSLATKENWNEEDRAMANAVRTVIQNAINKQEATSRPLTTKEALWMLYDSTNTVKDLVDAASRAFVAHNLGFDPLSVQRKQEVNDYVRFRTASNSAIDAATDMYNYETSLWTERLKESWLDMNQSVISLQKAMAEASGMSIEPWENLEFALNRLSSKSYADKKKYLRDFLIPMWDTILDIVKHDHVSIEDIERYMMLKHGLERNKKFASRDAKEFYRAMYDLVAERMKNQSHAQQVVALSEAKKALADIDAKIAVASSSQLPRLNEARARALYDVQVADLVLRGDEKLNEQELQDYYDNIDNELDHKYWEFREKDYGGLTSMFVDTTPVQRSNYKSEEAYQKAVLAATKPRFDKVADMEAEAQAEVDYFEKVVGAQNLWDKVNAATKETLRHQYEAGMITIEQYEAVRDMFKYYVPLRGFADNTAVDMYSYYMDNSASGFAQPILGAKGRKTRSESPLGWIGTMAESAIQADNKNEAKMTLYYATLRRPNQNLLSITETWYEYTGQRDANNKKIFAPAYPPATDRALNADELRQHMEDWEDDMKKKQSRGEAYKGSQKVDLKGSVVFQDSKEEKEHIIRVKVAGKDYSILINGNPRAAQAINGLLNPDADVSPIGEWVGKLRRGMSSLLTSFSPLFWVANYQRDLLSSFMRTSESEGWGEAFKYLANRRKAWRVASYVYKYENGTLGNSYYENLYKEFAENGGITGYTVLTTNKEYEQMFADYAKNVDRKVLNAVKGAFDKFMQFGEAIEQVSRFAAYITARESGKSIEEAVSAAKEVSVNFNRKGSAKPISLDELDKLRTKDGKKLNAVQKGAVIVLSAMPKGMKELYFFFNASVQALSSSAKLAKKSPGKAVTWAGLYFGTSIAMAMLNYLLSGDDDDEYLDLPDYLRHSTLLIKVSDDYYFKWSLPQEMRPFYAWADLLVSKAMGKMPHKNLGKEMALVAAQWLPVNPFEAEDPLLGLIPDYGSPIAEAWMNKTSFGGRIYDDMKFKSEAQREDIPAYRKATEKTGKVYVDLAELLNDISGGDEVVKGGININPAVVEHLVEGYGGGIYDFAKMMIALPSMLISDDPVEIKKIPFVNKVIMSVDETNMYSHVNDAFWHYSGIADNAKRVEKEYRESDDPSRADDYQKEEDWRIYLLYKQYESDFKNVKEKLDNAVDKEEEDLLKQEQNALREMFLNDIAKGDLPEVTFQIREDIKRIDKEIKEAMKPVSDANKERLEKKNAGDVDGMLKAIEKRDSLKETPEYRKAEEMKADLKEIKRQLEELGTVTRSSQRDSVIGEIQKNYDALIRKRAEL